MGAIPAGSRSMGCARAWTVSSAPATGPGAFGRWARATARTSPPRGAAVLLAVVADQFRDRQLLLPHQRRRDGRALEPPRGLATGRHGGAPHRRSGGKGALAGGHAPCRRSRGDDADQGCDADDHLHPALQLLHAGVGLRPSEMEPRPEPRPARGRAREHRAGRRRSAPAASSAHSGPVRRDLSGGRCAAAERVAECSSNWR